MMTILLAFILLSMVISVMAVGVILGRKPIAGSCGGIGAALGEKNYHCELCGGDPDKCDDRVDRVQKTRRETDIFYDATQDILNGKHEQDL